MGRGASAQRRAGDRPHHRPHRRNVPQGACPARRGRESPGHRRKRAGAHGAAFRVCHATRVNGVAEIHSELLKRTVFAASTNSIPTASPTSPTGVTQRRWLLLCDPELSRLIAGRIGTGFATDLTALKALAPHIEGMTGEFMAVKRLKKEQLSRFVRKHDGVELDPDFMFDVQIKRLHEYKRQLMNALSIYDLYCEYKAGTCRASRPRPSSSGPSPRPATRAPRPSSTSSTPGGDDQRRRGGAQGDAGGVR